jgi:hypothetical protein
MWLCGGNFSLNCDQYALLEFEMHWKSFITVLVINLHFMTGIALEKLLHVFVILKHGMTF